jgi:ATP-dependent RNA helicase DeaD
MIGAFQLPENSSRFREDSAYLVRREKQSPARPCIMTPKTFAELGLSEDLLKAIHKLGFEQAAPIQAIAIPLLMAGKDVVGQSQTGSGKTAAFAAPAIEKVDVSRRDTQILMLCPTRELAMQVSEEVHKLALFKRGVHALPIYGGQSYDRQLFGLRQGAHIVIGTPGRVMDHMRRGTLKLGAVKMVVLDEVDVMLNMGFRDDIELILQATPATRQTVFFSATIPRPIQHLIEKYARDPQQARIEQKTVTVPTVEQVYYEVDRRFKMDLLMRLIDLHDLKLGIIFCNTKRMVDDLADQLNAQGYSADRLHGDMTQMMRDRVMNKFRKAGLDFLVATDVAARGLDVDDVEVVFNYDLPYDGEDYVHRIGRTGRRGREGRAISFASGREVYAIRNIERYTNVRIQRGRPPTAGEVEEARANVFVDKLRSILKGGDFKRHDQIVQGLLEEGFASTDIISALIQQLQGGAAPAKPAPHPDRPRVSAPGAAVSDRRPTPPQPRRSPPAAALPPASPPRPQNSPAPAAAVPVPKPAPMLNPDPVAKPAPKPPRPVSNPVPNEAAVVAAPKPPAPRPASKPAVEVAIREPAPKPARPVSNPPSAIRDPQSNPRPRERERPSPIRWEKVAKPDEGILKPGEGAPARALNPPSAIQSGSPDPSGPLHQGRDGPATLPHPQLAAPEPGEGGSAIRHPQSVVPRPAFTPKTKRVAHPFQTRLWMNIGSETGIVPIDIVNTISGETGLPGHIVGTVDIHQGHLFVDVAAEHANAIISKLSRTAIKGHKLKVKAA